MAMKQRIFFFMNITDVTRQSEMANTSPSDMPCHFSARSSFYIIN